MTAHSDPADALLAFTVLDGAPGPIVVISRDWTILYANRAGVATFGRGDPALLRGASVFSIRPAWQGSPFQAQIERAFDGVSVAFEMHDEASALWLAVAASPVPEGVVVFVSDVTAQHGRAEELAAANAQLNAIINSSPDMVLAVDRNLNFLAFNRAYAEEFRRVFGRAIHVGMNFRDALADFPEARREAIARWERAALHGEEFTVQRELGADGSPSRVYEIRHGTLRDESGALVGAVSSMNDITVSARDRSQLAALTERLDAVIRYSPDRVVGVDGALRVVAMNDHARADFAEMWGTTINVGDSLYEQLSVLPAEQRVAATAMWEEAVAGTAVSSVRGLRHHTGHAARLRNQFRCAA